MKTLAPASLSGVSRVRSLILFAVLFVIATATLHAQGTAVRTETFSLRPNGEVDVENPRGATRVETWDFQTVRVVAEKKGPTGSSLDPGELVLMGAQNSIIVQCKQGTGRIDLTLYVPTSARLQVSGGVWPIDIGGGLAAAVVDSTSGNISYRLPANEDARVSMRSTMGTVRSTMSLAGVERSGVHGLQGQIGNGAAQLILSSQSGNVTLSAGPNSPNVARTSQSESGVQGAKAQSSRDVASTEPGTDSRTSGVQRTGRASSANRDPVQQSDPGFNDPGQINRAGQSNASAGQSNSSIVFAGSDRSDDSSQTVTNGPLTRPRTQRNTSGGNSGLSVHIIPSNGGSVGTARDSRDTAGSVFDQAAGDDDGKQGARSSTNGSSTGGASSTASGSNPSGSYPSSGSMQIGGNDRADDGTSNTRVGPLKRDRQTKNTSGGDTGLKVRIIPSNSSPSAQRDSSSVFDQRDVVEQSTEPSGSSTTRGAPQTGSAQSSRQGSNRSGTARRSDLPSGDDEEIASTNSRSSAPPVLQRGRPDESPSASGSGETDARGRGADEEAIVLKAALVSLNVSVTNRAGVAMANLKKEDFQIAENGESQNIDFFQPTTAPFNLVLLLDLSGSIKDKIDVVKSAALRFVEIQGPQDKIAVVTFTDEIRVVSQLTSDREELKRRIKSIDRSQGGTAFYEALWFSLLDTLRGTRGQRNAIVVMTDGVDSSLDRYNPMQTRVSFNQLARRLEESDVMVFPIYLDTEYEEVFERGNSSSEAYAVSRDHLERVAELTGGQMFKAEKVGDLSGVYKQVAAAIRTVYSVGYYPTNAEHDGTFRRVRVGVNRPDAAVRTRKGYYAK